MTENDQNVQVDMGTSDMEVLDRHAERNRSDAQHSEVIEAVPPVLMRGALYSFIAVTVMALSISIFTKIHVKVPGKGLIVPEGQYVSVESREAGVVVTVHVAEGDHVAKDAPIVTLQRSESQIDLATLRDTLKLERAKLDQLLRAREVTLEIIADPQIVLRNDVSSFVDSGPALVYVNSMRKALKDQEQADQNLKRFNEQERALTLSQIAISKDTLGQLQSKITNGQTMLAARRQTLQTKQEELAQIEILEAKRIVPRSQLTAARDAVNSAVNEVNQQQQEINQSKLTVASTRLSIANLESDLNKKDKEFNLAVEQARAAVDQAVAEMGSAITTLTNTINSAEANLAGIESKLNLQKVQIDDLKIVSPVDGVVTALNVNTAGRLVGRGNSIATIVPDAEKQIVMANVLNKDTAFITVGLPARVKVDAFPYRKFGTIDATVESLYPIPNKAEFTVRLALDKSTIKVRGKDMPLKPGMTVEVDLLTEKRRLIEIFLSKMN
ncbi:HlyD family efflux transporter periplasmic adaptor subunit [Magnetovibrio sp.]|uniref:HlyD family efflux transporter periplasmic adaptor subunit n=1 Tax=Magnetovibrio sp. TaxID=2024836 RepID=UPI002F92FC03